MYKGDNGTILHNDIMGILYVEYTRICKYTPVICIMQWDMVFFVYVKLGHPP